MAEDDGPVRWWAWVLLTMFAALLLLATGSALVQLMAH